MILFRFLYLPQITTLTRQLITGTMNVAYFQSDGADEFDQAVKCQTGVRLRRSPIVFFYVFQLSASFLGVLLDCKANGYLCPSL